MALHVAAHIFSAIDQLRVHATPKRLRAYVDGTAAFDTTKALVVWEPRRVVPTYAIPRTDLSAELTAGAADADAAENPVLIGDGPPVLDPSTAFAAHTTPGQPYDLVAARTLAGAAFAPTDADLEGYVIVDFDAFDEWREEDEVLVGHARDPFTRIDARQSSRHVVVEISGVKFADTTRPTVLFETYLPPRFYIPRGDVQMDLLQPTDTRTVCAYKGFAIYWSANIDGTVVPDVVWSYEDPHHDAKPVKDQLCFFNERVDLTIDGERLERPITPWS